MTIRCRKTAKARPSHVLAKLAVVPFDRDPDDLEAFIGEEIRVGEEADGAPVTVRFGGHLALDDSGASCVLYVYSRGREVLCLPLKTVDRMAVEMIGQAALGRQVEDPELVAIDLAGCVEPQHFDPTNPDDAATAMNWPLRNSKAAKKKVA